MSLVSVVVPVYNTDPEYLKPCLDSIVQQSYQELEIILVDDQSTSKATINTLDEYEAKDQRIKLVHIEKNGGLAFARNAGVAQAQGKYLTFLDSDDRFVPTYVETMVQILEQNNTEIALCNIHNFVLDPRLDSCTKEGITNLPELPYVSTTEFIQKKNIFLINTSAYGKMIRLDVYRKRSMDFNPQLRIWEDFEWNYRIFPKFKSFSFTTFTGIMRLVHSGSLSQETSMEKKNLYTLLTALKLNYFNFKQANLTELYYDQLLRFTLSFAIPRFSMTNVVDSATLLQLIHSFKDLLESCGYTFHKELSKFEVDPSLGKFLLVFSHISHPNERIPLQCNPSVALFVQVWKSIC